MPDPGMQMAVMLGVPEKHRAGLCAPPTEVWACHWDTVRLFAAMGTQWRTGMRGPTGLDYAALPVAARALGVRLTRRRFADLRTLEAEVLKIAQERADRG